MESEGDRPEKPRSAIGGRFWLEEKLSEDVSGEIHRAIDLRSGTPSLVRLVRSEGARRDRLLRETKRAAQVEHASLAIVLGVGLTEDGRVYIATERFVGDRLSDRLRGGERWDEWDAASIALQIAQALAVAHDAEVVHRELRPSLVVVATSEGRTVVKVEGLGVPQAPANEQELAYAAPEQRRGEKAGRRADVYSIGAILHAMLTGSAPDGAVIEGALGAVVRRCLAEDAKDRYLDTSALGTALKVILETRPVSRTATLRPPPASSRLPTTTLRPPTGLQPPPASPPAREPLPSPVDRPRPSSRPPSVRPSEVETAPISIRPPAAPPPRALGRPLTAQPRWKELLLDLRSGPLPRVLTAMLVVFVVARVLASTTAALIASVVAGVAFYATWGRPRGQSRGR